jgi:hypothetical protein
VALSINCLPRFPQTSEGIRIGHLTYIIPLQDEGGIDSEIVHGR